MCGSRWKVGGAVERKNFGIVNGSAMHKSLPTARPPPSSSSVHPSPAASSCSRYERSIHAGAAQTMEALRCPQLLHRRRPRRTPKSQPQLEQVPSNTLRFLQEGGGASVLPSHLHLRPQQLVVGEVQRGVCSRVWSRAIRLPAGRAESHHTRFLEQLPSWWGRIWHCAQRLRRW